MQSGKRCEKEWEIPDGVMGVKVRGIDIRNEET